MIFLHQVTYCKDKKYLEDNINGHNPDKSL